MEREKFVLSCEGVGNISSESIGSLGVLITLGFGEMMWKPSMLDNDGSFILDLKSMWQLGEKGLK